MISALRVNRTRHGTSVVNEVGRSMPVLDSAGCRVIRDDGERVGERHVRCHLTQGIEQQFVSTVVVQMLKQPDVINRTIRIMSQQHDGFVVWSSLPQADADAVVQRCVAAARATCLLGDLARLEMKPIG